ncbi:MAG: NADH-quinone oxidoreductase subunit L [Clostridia bacterium]|nr:NADH-quinone oxidoreductase subunit L [Clostridia bacterium]
MSIALLLLTPLLGAGVIFLLRKSYILQVISSLVFSLGHLALSVWVVSSQAVWEPGFGMLGFVSAFRCDPVAGMYLLLASGIFVLLSLFTVSYCRGKTWGPVYVLLLYISLWMIDGALLSDYLGLLLFFWEGLLGTLFGMLLIRNREHPKTAVKALSISGIADLVMMLGILMTIHAAGTAYISEISRVPLTGWGMAGCACLLAGALGKAGTMPFHSWIPDAASDAPTPFLAAFPGALEKIAGIYLSTRIIYQLYDFRPGSTISTVVMIIGSVTLFGGVAMALIQKDMKRLLSYHAISQVGYIVVGLGSALPVGLAGAVFHLINNAVYKSGLFMVAGAVEQRTGTTDLHAFSGLRKKMPLVCIAAVIFALSIAGFPGTNGFYSKELIFDAALETHIAFYLVALFGAFMTAASFLKMTRAAFFGKYEVPAGTEQNKNTAGVVLPACVLAAVCLFLGIFNRIPIDGWIGGAYGLTETFGGFPSSIILVLLSAGILLLAVADHVFGSLKTGRALNAADHLHDIPGIKQIYGIASAGYLEPYRWLEGILNIFASACDFVEKGVTWLYDEGVPAVVRFLGKGLSEYDTGSLSRYLTLALVGVLLVGITFILVIL